VRLNIANANYLKAHKDVVDRYIKAYRETVNYLYTDPNALKVYSEWLKITEAKAKRTRDDFFPRAAIEPDKIVGLDTIVKDAVALKFTAAELTKAQLDDLIQIPPR
jgi:NitT/TauT family transport system substrate-binding protein